MSIDSSIADYELADQIVVTAPAQLRALADPLRAARSRSATRAGRDGGRARHGSRAPEEHRGAPRERPCGDRNAAGRANEAGTRDRRALLRPYRACVLRRRREPSGRGPDDRACECAVRRRCRVAPAHEADNLRSILRHARVEASAARFWERVVALSHEFAQLPRSGDTAYGFAAGLYPTDYPTLPDPIDDPG